MPNDAKNSMLFFHRWRKTLKKLPLDVAMMVVYDLVDVDAGDPPSYDLSKWPKAEGIFESLNDFNEEKREHYADVCKKRSEAVKARYQDSTKSTNATNVANVDDRIGIDRNGKDKKDKIVKIDSKKSKNRFKNFDEREYSTEEMDALEETLSKKGVSSK